MSGAQEQPTPPAPRKKKSASCCSDPDFQQGGSSLRRSIQVREDKASENRGPSQIKLLMIGDSGVGKTCLVLRFVNDSFSHTFITTIGIDYKLKTVDVDGHEMRLQVWDTAGQERFRTITRSYFRGAQGIFLTYSVTDRLTFESIRSWVKQIGEHGDQSVTKILVGNKCDASDDEREVTYAEGEQLAKEFKIPFMETSAKNNVNVEAGFVELARQFRARDRGVG